MSLLLNILTHRRKYSEPLRLHTCQFHPKKLGMKKVKKSLFDREKGIQGVKSNISESNNIEIVSGFHIEIY